MTKLYDYYYFQIIMQMTITKYLYTNYFKYHNNLY